MSILYTTSFNKPLYEKSGKKMISTFLEHSCDGDLFLSYEDNINRQVELKFGANDRFIYYNLSKDLWLKEWTEKFKNYLPRIYGGIDRPLVTHNLTKFGISPHQIENIIFFRMQTARWFRKIVALRAALFHNQYKYLAFCDCDTLFYKTLPFKVVDKVCKDHDVIYHMGKTREQVGTGIESGFIFFNLERQGKKFLEYAFDLYESGKFLEYLRWDDSYIFYSITKELKLDYLDLVPNDANIVQGHVVEHGPFCEYLRHLKGSHKEIIGIRK